MSNARTYGTIHSEQKPFVIQHANSTDYLLGGSLVMTNGKIDKYLFEGGYAQATSTSKTTDSFAFNYYNQDNLGNNREVVDAKVGYTCRTNFIRTQIEKDVWLMNKNPLVEKSVWHFYRSPITGKIGPSGPLMEQLDNAGIKIIIHF